MLLSLSFLTHREIPMGEVEWAKSIRHTSNATVGKYGYLFMKFTKTGLLEYVIFSIVEHV